MQIDGAAEFVNREGKPLDKARSEALRTRRAAPSLPLELLTARNQDGGWAQGTIPGRPSSLHDTIQALDICDDLGLMETSVARDGIVWVKQRQTRRGLWREAPELQAFELPAWANPGEPAADVFTTALCAGALASYDDDTLPVDRAVSWLQTQQARDGLLPGWKLHSSWLALPAFVQILDVHARPVRRLVAGLGEALGPDWTGAMLAQCLRSTLRAGYTTRTLLVQRAWDLLQRAQEPDGAVTVDDGEPKVEATLRAIAVAIEITRDQG